MTRSEFCTAIFEKYKSTGVTKQAAADWTNAIFDTLFEKIITDDVELRGFGFFRHRITAPRVGRNPRTGERIEIPSERRVVFIPNPALYEAVKNYKEEDAN